MSKFAKWFILVGVLLLVPLITFFRGSILVLWYWLDGFGWTGFKGKTLWDWLNLLGVLAIPAMVGFGSVWFTAQHGKVSRTENMDNQREYELQAYINAMLELLLNRKLRSYSTKSEIRYVAQLRTLTVLRRLDGVRKGYVLYFLREANLIGKEDTVVSLRGADLRDIDLRRGPFVSHSLSSTNRSGAKRSLVAIPIVVGLFAIAAVPVVPLAPLVIGAIAFGAGLASDAVAHLASESPVRGHLNLDDVNLSGADLSYANLSSVSLLNADLTETNLTRANLRNADLSGANLTKAKVTRKQLKNSKSIKDTIMPDGKKNP